MTGEGKGTVAYHVVKLCHMLVHFLFDSDRILVFKTGTTSIPLYFPGLYNSLAYTATDKATAATYLSHTYCSTVLSPVYIAVCTSNVALLSGNSG